MKRLTIFSVCVTIASSIGHLAILFSWILVWFALYSDIHLPTSPVHMAGARAADADVQEDRPAPPIALKIRPTL